MRLTGRLTEAADEQAVLASGLAVDVTEGDWSGVIEAGREWPTIAEHGALRLELSDGRSGEIVATRTCGGDLGGATVFFQGAGPLEPLQKM